MKSIYLVGGGPSLDSFDWSLLDGREVVAINRALQVLPRAQHLFWSDWLFFANWKQSICLHDAPSKVTGIRPGDTHGYEVVSEAKALKFIALTRDSMVTAFTFTGANGLDLRPGCLRHGNNAGYAAINYVMQAFGTWPLGMVPATIYLMGYDMRWHDGRSHWHTGYAHARERVYDKMLPYFHSLGDAVPRALGYRVVNLVNPDFPSRLQAFETQDIKEHFKCAPSS